LNEQQIELGQRMVERAPAATEQVVEHEAARLAEGDHIGDLRPIADGGEHARLDDHHIELGQPLADAVQHGELGALHVDLAQRRARELADHLVEGAATGTVSPRRAERADLLEEGRAADIVGRTPISNSPSASPSAMLSTRASKRWAIACICGRDSRVGSIR